MVIKIDNLKTVEITDNFITKSYELAGHRRNSTRKLDLKKAIQRRLSQGGQDKTQTSLKRLPYTEYSIVSDSRGIPYFCGKTENLSLEIKHNRNDEAKTFDVGPYFVCLSVSSAMAMEINPVHIFPARKPLTRNRHLHHYAEYYPDDIKNPLDANPHTCWASIGPSYLNAIENADVVDMFRIMYIYLVRMDYDSVYCWDWTFEAVEYGERIE